MEQTTWGNRQQPGHEAVTDNRCVSGRCCYHCHHCQQPGPLPTNAKTLWGRKRRKGKKMKEEKEDRERNENGGEKD